MQTLDKAHTRARIEGMAAAASLNISQEARELAHLAQQGDESDGLAMTPVAMTPPAIGAYWHELEGVYAGIASGFGAEPDAYLILHLARPPADMDWQAAKEWAATFGEGWRLPTRDEAALLYAHLRGRIHCEFIWTITREGPRLALLQSFQTGTQMNYNVHWTGGARAVRRVDMRRLWSITPAPTPQTSANAMARAEVAL